MWISKKIRIQKPTGGVVELSSCGFFLLRKEHIDE